MVTPKSALALLFASSVFAASVAAEDPLPPVKPKATTELPSVVLASYPFRDVSQGPSIDTRSAASIAATLRESAAQRDYPRFTAALAAAKAKLESLPAGDERNALRRAVVVADDLEAVWGYEMNDRLGAFYDNEALPGLHEHLTATYPGFETAIAADRITDRNGHVFYPSDETRAFLARQLGPVPSHKQPQAVRAAKKPARSATTHRAALKASAEKAKPAPAKAPAKAPALQPAVAAVALPIPPPIVAAKAPPVVAAQVPPAPPVVAAKTPPVASQAPTTAAPVPPAVAPPAPAAASVQSETPIVTAAETPKPVQPQPQPGDQAQIIGTTASRGVLLILTALAGIGAVAALLRPPKPAPKSPADSDHEPQRHTA
jgi:hypothetical protein